MRSLTVQVLVVLECVRAFAALSEKQSLLSIPPWANPYLGLGMVVQVSPAMLGREARALSMTRGR